MAVSVAPGLASPLGERFAATPRHACRALVRALGQGELEAALACFAPDACLILADGTAVHGEAAIRTRLAELIAGAAEVAIELAGVLAAGDTALAYERWRIRSEEAASLDHSHHPTLVLRRQGEEWKLAIAAPWGWAPAPPLEAIAAPQ
ncbi:MAG TPA: nuclear transport factor 2 family protein [Solirubrobacterales bacterium]|nr:nuclear transport factor 2 family protein [Solirubrobacterales bacterium]